MQFFSFFFLSKIVHFLIQQVAKSLVKAGLCRRCLVQSSYAIGVAKPLSINITTYGTSEKSEEELLAIIEKNFDFRPGEPTFLSSLVLPSMSNPLGCIIKELDLLKPRYEVTARYGHFGHEGPEFTWEHPKKLVF